MNLETENKLYKLDSTTNCRMIKYINQEMRLRIIPIGNKRILQTFVANCPPKNIGFSTSYINSIEYDVNGLNVYTENSVYSFSECK